MKLKKQICFLLTAILILPAIITTATADSNSIDSLLTEAGIRNVAHINIKENFAYAENGKGGSLLVGRRNNDPVILLSEKGEDYKLLDITVNDLVSELIEDVLPEEWVDPETGDICSRPPLELEYLPSSAYYYEDAYRILAIMASESEMYPIMITVNANGTAKAEMLPTFNRYIYGNLTVFLEKRGEKYILVPEYSAYEESETAYGIYYTSEDLTEWTKHTTPEKTTIDENVLKVEDISADGTVLFSNIVGYWMDPDSVTYFYTKNHTDYHPLTGGMFEAKNGVNDKYYFQSSPKGNKFYAVRCKIAEYEYGYKKAGIELWCADSPDGEWIKAAEHVGEYNRDLLTVTDSGACLMVGYSDVTHMYKYTKGECKEFTTDIDLSMFGSVGGEMVLQYGELILLWENGNTFLCTTDLWETTHRIYFPGSTTRFRMGGSNIYFCSTGSGGVSFAVSANMLANTVPGVGVDSDGAGDVDKNGKLSLTDTSMVLKYIAGWGIDLDTAVADVNKDNFVNLTDASLMLKYIAGWDVILK